jgi:hypothetical protein
MVLLYAQDAAVAAQLRCLLAELGQTVHAAASLADARRITRAHAPTLAVVQHDDGVTGWRFCRQIQTLIGWPVIGVLPLPGYRQAAEDLYLLPLPVAPCALRVLVQRLQGNAAAVGSGRGASKPSSAPARPVAG